MKITIQLESPESLEALAEFICFVGGTRKAFEKRFGRELQIPVDFQCIDWRGRKFKPVGMALIPADAT